MEIRPGGLDHPDTVRLLAEHLASAALHSPPGSVHALDLSRLRAPDLSVYSAWDGTDLLGIAALRELAPDRGEIKSMRTVTAHQRRGVAAALLTHLITVARGRGYRCLCLETGSMEAFAPARALYARFGFVACAPFGDYADDPFSIYMRLALA